MKDMSPAERRAYGQRMLERIDELDRLLQRHGWPALSEWWWATLCRFYLGGKRRFVLRVGRRGGKSTTMCRVAVIEALYGEHEIPPGDKGVFSIISVDKEEAAERLDTIEEILKVMRVEYHRGDGLRPTIETTSCYSKRPIVFRVFPATIKGVSGPTCVGAICDEMAKWADKDTGANPATEVIRSLAPSMATMKLSKLWMVSSPFADLDAHYDAFEKGETPAQSVAWAPTWVANPTLSEEYTHTLEEDLLTWEREYGAKPMSGGTVYFFDHEVLDVAAARAFEVRSSSRRVAGLDAAFRKDSAACVPMEMAKEFYAPLSVVELTPKPGKPLVPGEVIDGFAKDVKAFGIEEFVADLHYIESVREHATRNKMRVHDGYADKEKAHIDARVLLNRGLWCLAGYPKLVRQLKEVKSKPLPSGTLKIFSDRTAGSHGDVASAWIEGVWFLAQGGGRVLVPTKMRGAGGLAAGGRWGNAERGY